MATCNRCDKIWQGFTECHCATCHQQFKSESAFNKHRVKFTKGSRRCLNSEEMEKRGMVFYEDKGYWVTAVMPEGRFERHHLSNFDKTGVG